MVQFLSLQRRARRALRVVLTLAAAAALALPALFPRPTYAATSITVTTTADETAVNGSCSLREAIRAASGRKQVDACPAGTGDDTIVVPAGTYLLGSVLRLTHSVTIRGAGAGSTIISGNGVTRVFDVSGGATVLLDRLTITKGKSSKGGGISNDDGNVTISRSAISSNIAEFTNGGGVYNEGLGTMTIVDSTISGNYAKEAGGGVWSVGYLTMTRVTVSGNNTKATPYNGRGTGGGVAANGWTTIADSTISGNSALSGGGVYAARGRDDAALTISGSTISGNSAIDAGGGLVNRQEMSVIITNSTIANNTARTDGGGILNNGGCGTCSFQAVVWLRGSTVAGNVADSDANGSGNGGGLHNVAYDKGDRIRLANSIIANNVDRGYQARDFAGSISSYGYNLIRSTSGGKLHNVQTGNKYNVDPKLGSLAGNGGLTKTMALLSGSPALDAGSPEAVGGSDSACLPKDQRGVSRPDDGNGDGKARCDIGAFERTSQLATVAGDAADVSVAEKGAAAPDEVEMTEEAAQVLAAVVAETPAVDEATPVDEAAPVDEATPVDEAAPVDEAVTEAAPDVLPGD